MRTVVLLVEQELSDADVAEVEALHADEPAVRWHVVVPQGLPPVALAAAMPGAPLGEGVAMGLPGTLPPMPPDFTAEEAAEILEQCLGKLREHDLDVDGEVVDPDPVDALRDCCRRLQADEVVCLTRHHRVAEMLHRDWASRARDAVEVPVVLVHSRAD
jgi:nucleotide-binding universal stress UspA family protein